MTATYTAAQALADFLAGDSLRTVATRLGLKPGTARGKMIAAAGGATAYNDRVAKRKLTTRARDRASFLEVIQAAGRGRAGAAGLVDWGCPCRLDSLQPGQRFRLCIDEGFTHYGRLTRVGLSGCAVRLECQPNGRTVRFETAEGNARTVTFGDTSRIIYWSGSTHVEPAQDGAP